MNSATSSNTYSVLTAQMFAVPHLVTQICRLLPKSSLIISTKRDLNLKKQYIASIIRHGEAYLEVEKSIDRVFLLYFSFNFK